ncbi:galactose mutarotase-like enzyme [Sphaerochaeta pleomorpha str. Grapes]|uniref:Galactose mutarotase-like enzyme n=1 Tax=Sphaerochaeta pleomorpha (strain ATCC BAA-1885 / DSM 22778 / Grapes) TaxID=158190 RepID=G8QU42_SPHPG|nr:aldose 1-epimerase [Sphaerochaeta pleomorpha]AEV30289.1 galactose mutarotase-like enzyme [Sphaerochaeta pleomorpha str. Grapes]
MIVLHTKDSRLVVDEECGFTITSWEYKGIERLVFDRARIAMGKTSGIPILFPTPNRIKEGTFVFEGQRYQGFMHGRVRFERFTVLQQTATTCKGAFCCREGNRVYETFPFLFTLTIEIVLGEKGISWHFEIENQDDKHLPFGIAIHPYLKKLGPSQIKCSAEYVMENDNDLCPLGSLGDSALLQAIDVEETDLDLVFYAKEHAVVTEFFTGGACYRLFGSEDFHHTVIYTPRQEPFVCIEPQSCSTDSINLYSHGFSKLSGLQILSPGEKKKELIAIELGE